MVVRREGPMHTAEIRDVFLTAYENAKVLRYVDVSELSTQRDKNN